MLQLQQLLLFEKRDLVVTSLSACPHLSRPVAHHSTHLLRALRQSCGRSLAIFGELAVDCNCNLKIKTLPGAILFRRPWTPRVRRMAARRAPRARRCARRRESRTHGVLESSGCFDTSCQSWNTFKKQPERDAPMARRGRRPRPSLRWSIDRYR